MLNLEGTGIEFPKKEEEEKYRQDGEKITSIQDKIHYNHLYCKKVWGKNGNGKELNQCYMDNCINNLNWS